MATLIVNDDLESIEKLSQSAPVLIDFWAEWCPPCKQFNPILEAFEKKHEGVVHVVKVNVDDNQHLAHIFRIQSIPTVVVVKQGIETVRNVGVVNVSGLERIVGIV